MTFITANRPIRRRQVISLIGGGVFLAASPKAMAQDDGIGTVMQINGPGQVGRLDQLADMLPGMALFVGDRAVTGSQGRAHLGLGRATEIHLGPQSELQIDRFVAEIGGVIYLNGAIVFDRDDTAAPIDLEFQTQFGRIAVRGTRFFVGPSNDVFAVFVERGRVAIMGAGVTRVLVAGEGAVLRGRDVPPGPVETWKKPRIDAAFASVLGT